MSGRSLLLKARDIGLESDRTYARRLWRWGNGYNYDALNPKVGKPGFKGLPLTKNFWAWVDQYVPKDWRKKKQSSRVWRNAAVWDEPARWNLPEWVPKKATGFLAQWRQGLYDLDANRSPGIIPFLPTMSQGLGTDRGLIIHIGDKSDGVSYELQNLRAPNAGEILAINFRCLGDYYRAGDLICDGVASITPENRDSIVGRGGGHFIKQDGHVDYKMIDSGVINTCIASTGYAINFGPGAIFRLPGDRVEHMTAAQRQTDAKVQFGPGINDQSTPHSTRYCIDWSDAQIDQWLNSKNYKPAKRRTARIFAIALRDYGWIRFETNNWADQIEIDGVLTPDSLEGWKRNGLETDDDFNTLLDGLFTEDNIQVVKEAA